MFVEAEENGIRSEKKIFFAPNNLASSDRTLMFIVLSIE